MPKLDGTHIVERLQTRLEQLYAGEQVAARDLRALLNDEQIAEMNAAWAYQQVLRKNKRARTKAEERQLGWLSKRDLHIAALEAALIEARDAEEAAWDKRLFDAEVRGARIYFDELGRELKEGNDLQTAKNRANNALTRAGLRRMDGQMVRYQSVRDRQVQEMERAILQRAEAAMTDEEREQMELLREHEAAVAKRR